jgi:hypothetical protein
MKRLQHILAAAALALSAGAANASTVYWSLSNFEGESAISATYVTYASLTDMLFDTNRTGNFSPNNFNAGNNIIGSGASIFKAPPPPPRQW